MALIMTVVPGFGGQALIPETLEKVRTVRRYAQNMGLKLDVQVDGGIKTENVHLVTEAGANIIVAGSSIFGAKKPREVITNMRKIAKEHSWQDK
jgi:ribulose-phosphate 3-epimerase